jgi:hypothetical protein
MWTRAPAKPLLGAAAPAPIDRRRLLTVFGIGAVLNLTFLALLYAHPVARENLYPPEGVHQGNAWEDSDVMGYVHRARNFLRYGVFGKGEEPGTHRTVGYPFFLASAMILFGEYWVLAVLVMQALLAAAVYGAVFDLGGLVCGGRIEVSRLAVILLGLSGAFCATVPALLTDLTFAALFTIGLWLGVSGVARRNVWHLVAQIGVLGAAAQVRPTLVLYPAVHVIVLVAAARGFGVLEYRDIRWGIVASGLFLILACGAPAIRNAVNHGYFHPSDALEINLFKQLTHRILRASGEEERFHVLRSQVDAVGGFEARIKRQREVALAEVRAHPWITAKIVAIQASAVLGSSHWLRAARLLGWSEISLVRTLALAASVTTNVIVDILCGSLVWTIARRRNWLMVSALLALPIYLLLPTFIDAAGPRMRLPVEAALILGASCEVVRRRSHDAAFTLSTPQGT